MAGANSQYYQPSPWQAQGQAAYNQPSAAYSQHSGYQGIYHEQGQSQLGRPAIQSGPQTCYNCGSPDHWAQHCPEPHRAVPAGSLNRPNNPRPNKRHKVNGPIVTRYPVPPHMAMHQATPQAYGSTPYSKPGFHQQYPQQHPQYGPPTPVSAYAVPNQQWPQPQQQHYNTAYSHGYHYPQYGPQQPPTPATSYGPQYPSPISAQGPPLNNGFFQQNGPFQEQAPPQGVGYGGPMNPPLPPTPSSNQQWPQQISQHAADDSRDGPSDLIDRPPPASANSGNTSELPVEPDSEDALEDLDIPDIPINRHKAMDWHPPRLVLRPFASDYFAEEVIATLPPPQKADGSSISRYLTASNCQESLQSVRETNDWPSFKDDPVFQRIADDGPSIPVDYLRAHRALSERDEPRDDSESEEGEFSRGLDAASSQEEHKGGSGWSVMDNLEQALNSRNLSTTTKQRHLARVDMADSASVEPRRPVDDDVENVSGPPSPPSNSTFAAYNKALGQTTSSQSRSPESLGDRDHPAPRLRDLHKSPTSMDGFQGRESNLSRRGSRDEKYHIHSKRRDSHRSSSEDHEWPTKPSPSEQNTNPPTVRSGKAAPQHGSNVSPPSSSSSRDQKHATHGRYASHNERGRHGPNGHATSPRISRSERSNPLKREFDHRDSSEEPEKERRRQADDVTPKLKRRQPKVAEAYSRRW